MASGLLWMEFRKGETLSGYEPIAMLIKKENDVRRRHENSMLWHPIVKGTDLYQNDFIRTANNSEAKIALYDNSKIQMEENTLIILRLQEEESIIEMIEGKMLFDQRSTKPKQRTLLFKNSKITSLNAVISVSNVYQKEATVELIEGEAILHSFDEEAKINSVYNESSPEANTVEPSSTTTIKKGQRVVINQTGNIDKKDIQITLIQPAPNKKVHLDDEGESVIFRWKIRGQASNVEFQLAGSPRFETLLAQETNLKQSEIAYPLQSGTFYWRVIAKLPNKSSYTQSIVYRLEVVKEVPITILRPQPDETIYMAKYQAQFHFLWVLSPNIESSQITVAKDKRFRKIIWQSEELVAQSPNVLFNQKMKQGKYYYKITAHRKNRVKTYKKVHSLFLKEDAKRAKLVESKTEENSPKKERTQARTSSNKIYLLHPKQGYTHPLPKRKSKSLYFSWSKIKTAYNYQLTLKVPNNDNPTIKKTKRPNVNIYIKKKGNYSWSVIAFDRKGKKVGQSKSFQFKADHFKPLPAPILLPPSQ